MAARRGVIRNPFQMPRGQNKLHAGNHLLGLLGHLLQQLLENSVAILIHQIVALQHLRRHHRVAINQRAQALCHHRPHRHNHGFQLFRRL